MITNLKKSLKLLKYGYKFKYNIAINVVILVIVAILYTLTFVLSADLFLLNFVLLYVAISIPSQIREDLLHSQMLASSGFRRFFEIGFGDIYAFFSSIIAYMIHGVLLLSFYKEDAFTGGTLTTLLVSAGFCIGAMATGYALINKTFWAGLITYFVMGFCNGFCSSAIVDLEASGRLHLNKASAFVIGLSLVVIGFLLAMLGRRLVYKKSYSRFSTSGELQKAMQV
ncbi:MAG: hypothetical protein IKK33_02990 [Lachnospiraceae bacterium]|nr:hypothetical protein [Lachnospiraceae bacterium]